MVLSRLLLITFACVSSTLVKEAVFRDWECSDLYEEQQVHFGDCWWWTKHYDGCSSFEYILEGSTLITQFWEVKQQVEDFPDGTRCHPDEAKPGCSSVYTFPVENVSYQLDMCTELPKRVQGSQAKSVKYTILPPVSMTVVVHEDRSCTANKVVLTQEYAMEHCFTTNGYAYDPNRSWRYVCGPQNTTIELQYFEDGNCSGPLNDLCVYNEDGSINKTASGSYCSHSLPIGCRSRVKSSMSIADNPCTDTTSSFQVVLPRLALVLAILHLFVLA